MVKMNYSFTDEGNLSPFFFWRERKNVACDMQERENRKKPSSLLVEDDRREALLLGHSIMCASVVHERLDVVLDHLAAAVRALFSKVSPFSVHTVVETGRLSQTHNDRLLSRLDG